MKQAVKLTVCLLACVVLLVGCAADTANVWAEATYTADTTLGTGQKTVTVEVTAQETTITLTLHTDKATVGEALQEQGLIEGEPGAYGLYVKKVNGITADYDVNKAYWAFYENGQYAMAGVDTTNIAEGVTYGLVYTQE